MKRPYLTGVDVLHNPTLNKGTGFTEEERDALEIRGLLPPRVFTLDEQTLRVMENFRAKTSPLEKFIFLTALQDRNETLFYRTLIDNIEQMMPFIYTPTVGEACLKYAHIFRRPRGLYISSNDKGRIARILKNWPERDVRAIVVTDGERILGLGDLGANGMGIAIGKLSIYTACAGVAPWHCLPIMLDVGTENREHLEDPLYIGLVRRRVRGAEYDELVEEFMEAVKGVYPQALVQFEDFGNQNAFRLLSRYRERYCMFNDDIQGTAAVTLAGLLSATRITGKAFEDQRFLFLGAGEAAIGIADLVVAALAKQGVPESEGRARCWFVDSQGLVVRSRSGLQEHKLPYAHDHVFLPDLASAVEALKPSALIGVSGQAQAFTKSVVEAMAKTHDRPIIFALSNPTSKAECSAKQAYSWTNGRAVFASGSPFGPVEIGGRTLRPGQANNAYIFPGVGLGVIASGAHRVEEEMFLVAARTLAELVTPESLEVGALFPPLSTIRETSAHIAARVANVAYDRGLASGAKPDDLASWIRASMYDPKYESYV